MTEPILMNFGIELKYTEIGNKFKQNKTLVSIKAATSGFGESKDLLSPVSLFHFTAVTRVKDPPTEESKLDAHSA